MRFRATFAKTAACLCATSLVLVTSCNPASDGSDYDRSTPEIAREATITRCPSVTPYPTPNAKRPKLVFALVDKSKSYQKWTQPALVRFAKVLPIIVAPGDEFIVAWIGTDSEDPTEVFFHESAPEVPLPTMEASPRYPVLTSTPTVRPTPTYPSGGLTFIQELEYRAACESIRLTTEQQIARVEQNNDSAINSYFCSLGLWNADCDTAIGAWERETQRAVDAFAAQASATIGAVDIGGFDEWTHIYEALWVVSGVFRGSSTYGRFEGHKLVVFSDMQDDRLGDRDDLPLELGGVDVVVAMFHCEEAYRCEVEKDHWTKVFESAGAQSTRFLLVVESTVENLASALR